jgi:GntR family transcriptional regulator
MIRTSIFRIVVGAHEPIYRQLVDQVRRLVASGELQAGDEIPSVRDIAHELRINPMTVSKAFGLLEEEKLLVRQRGRPMVVVQQHATARSLPDRISLLRPIVLRAAQESRDLRLPHHLVVDLLQSTLGDVNA